MCARFWARHELLSGLRALTLGNSDWTAAVHMPMVAKIRKFLG
jgi:hypothetical protein